MTISRRQMLFGLGGGLMLQGLPRFMPFARAAAGDHTAPVWVFLFGGNAGNHPNLPTAPPGPPRSPSPSPCRWRGRAHSVAGSRG